MFVYLNVPKAAIHKFLRRLLDSKKNVGGLCPPTLLVCSELFFASFICSFVRSILGHIVLNCCIIFRVFHRSLLGGTPHKYNLGRKEC